MELNTVMTLDQVAQIMGTTRQNVHAIEKRALAKLRRGLWPYLQMRQNRYDYAQPKRAL
jgi:DNA-directed RNA polymerase sigma subunit (sigma70/sigma32)